MAGAVGSGILSAIGLSAVCILTLLLLRHYLPLRSNPAYLVIPVYLAIAIPASVILLVPIDLVSTAGTDTGGARGVWLSEDVVLLTWKLSYWISFALTWAILPLLGEYEDSGYREPKERVLYSLRSNGQYYALMLGCSILAGIYFFINSGFQASSVRALVMALAYAWGLILAIYLMGHGLVALPRRLIKNASISGRLKRLQARAPKVHERLTDAVDNLGKYEDQVAQLQRRKTGSARDYQEWIDDLVDMCALPEARISSVAPRASGSEVPHVITDGFLADLTRHLKRARHKKLRFTDEWDRLVRDANDTQAILDSLGSKKLEFGHSAPHASFLERLNILTPYTRYLLHTKVLPGLRYALGFILSLASITLVWSEVMKSADPKLSLVGLTVVHHPRSDRPKIGFAGQLIAALWLLYMCVAALTSVAEVKIWGNRALVKRGTYAESACWYSGLVCRLTVPLAYNFVTFVQPNIFRGTVFYQFLGEYINLTPLGKGFSNFFPIFLLIPVAAALFNLYGKIQNAIGFGNVMEEDDDIANPDGYATGSWREGRSLIAREVQGGASSQGVGLAPRSNSPPSRSPSPMPRHAPSHQREQRAHIPARVAADDQAGEDGGFFDDFAHRVRNTFDTAERPAWMENIRKPRWLGGDDQSAEGSGETGLARWFGGRSAEGRLRLL